MSKNHTIYIIHGILGGKYEYGLLRKTLKKEGFISKVFSYKSRKEHILEVSKRLYEEIKKDKTDEIYFITHSLGALILRALLLHSSSDIEFPNIKRVVMIAPPNQGTVAGNFMHKYAFFKLLLGVNLREVKNDADALARKLPEKFPLKTEVGIIAGIRGNKYGYNPFIGSDNDGEIKPEETKLGTENDFVTVKRSHITILQSKKTSQLTLQFLKTGSFYIK